MPEILVKRTIAGLVPANEEAEEAMRRIPIGRTIKAKVWVPRNVKFHNKFFSMLAIVFKNQSRYKSMETLLCVCKLATGHAEIVRTKHGDVAIPQSISFAKMDGAAFSKFYDAAVAWVLADVIPGLKRSELDAEIEKELREFAA